MDNCEQKERLAIYPQFIRRWNPDHDNVEILRRIFIDITEIARHFKDSDIFDELDNYQKFYVDKNRSYKYPLEISAEDVQEFFDSDPYGVNCVIASDFEGNCLLKLGIDEFGNTLNSLYNTMPVKRAYKSLKHKERLNYPMETDD